MKLSHKLNTKQITTLISIGFLVFGADALIHEGFGHGLTAIVLGADPEELTSAYWNADYSNVTNPHVVRVVTKTMGTGANLITMLIALVLFFIARNQPKQKSGIIQLVLLFFFLTNGLSGFGYMMVGPLFGFGDWGSVCKLLGDSFLLKLVLTMIGVIGSLGIFHTTRRLILPWMANKSTRTTRAKSIFLIPYVFGASMVVFSTIFNPLGTDMIVSAATANFMGCVWMVWLAFDPSKEDSNNIEVEIPEATLPLIILSIAMTVFTVFILGPGISF